MTLEQAKAEGMPELEGEESEECKFPFMVSLFISHLSRKSFYFYFFEKMPKGNLIDG